MAAADSVSIALSTDDERLDPLPILRFDEFDGKSAGNIAHDAADDLADRERGSDLGQDVRRDRGPADRDIDDETGDHRSVRERQERERAPRDKARVRAIVGDREIFIPYYPIDPAREHLAFSIGRLDTHREAELEHPNDRTADPPELLDIGGRPDAHFGGDRGSHGDLVHGYVYGPAAKQSGIAPCLFSVPKRVAPGKAHIVSFVIPAIDNSVVPAIDDKEIKRLDIRHDQSFRPR